MKALALVLCAAALAAVAESAPSNRGVLIRRAVVTAESSATESGREQLQAKCETINAELQKAREEKRTTLKEAVAKPPPTPDLSFLADASSVAVLNSGYPVGLPTASATDTFTASEDPDAQGVVIYVLCRATDAPDGEHIVLAWRPFLLTPDGRIRAIGKETPIRASVYTDQG